MFGFGGIAVVLVMWGVMVAGVARLAVARGRNPYGWGIGAAVASLIGIAAGAQIAARWLSVDDLGSFRLVAAAIALPVGGAVVPVAIIAFVLAREPIKVSAGAVWRVHFVEHGPGTIRFGGEIVRFEWEGGGERATRAQLGRVEPDGECVRIALGDRELAALPLGKPDTPEGRRQQARTLASRLRG